MLAVYTRPRDGDCPLVCLDETSKQLIAETRVPISMKAGRPARFDFRVSADKVTGSKEVRAEPYAAQVQGGNVAIVAGDWNRGFLDEHEQFPAGRRKDQVDASAGAFNKLTTGSRYDTSMLWVTHTDGVRDA